MKISAIVAISLLFSACTSTPAADCDVDQAIFCAPFKQLATELTPQDKERLIDATPKDIILMHHGFGTGIRNRFGLWRSNDLTAFFNANGVDHPDDMSGPFITGFIGYLQGRRVVMAQEIERVPLPPPPPEPPR